jgi:hypothetical protein
LDKGPPYKTVSGAAVLLSHRENMNIQIFLKIIITMNLFRSRNWYSSPPLMKPLLLLCKRGLSWGDDLLVFYYLSASEIWSDKRGGFWREWPSKRGTTGIVYSKKFVKSYL